MDAEHQPHEVGLRAGDKTFSFSGGPAYLLVAVLALIGGMWVFGEYILPKTSPQKLESTKIDEAIRNQVEILRILRQVRETSVTHAWIEQRLNDVVRQSDRDLDRLLALAEAGREKLERILFTLASVPPAKLTPRHHSE